MVAICSYTTIYCASNKPHDNFDILEQRYQNQGSSSSSSSSSSISELSESHSLKRIIRTEEHESDRLTKSARTLSAIDSPTSLHADEPLPVPFNPENILLASLATGHAATIYKELHRIKEHLYKHDAEHAKSIFDKLLLHQSYIDFLQGLIDERKNPVVTLFDAARFIPNDSELCRCLLAKVAKIKSNDGKDFLLGRQFITHELKTLHAMLSPDVPADIINPVVVWENGISLDFSANALFNLLRIIRTSTEHQRLIHNKMDTLKKTRTVPPYEAYFIGHRELHVALLKSTIKCPEGKTIAVQDIADLLHAADFLETSSFTKELLMKALFKWAQENPDCGWEILNKQSDENRRKLYLFLQTNNSQLRVPFIARNINLPLQEILVRTYGRFNVSVADIIRWGLLPDCSLGALDLSDFSITNLEGLDQIPNPRTISIIHLSHNFISSLEANSFQSFENLSSLNLGNNRIATIDDNAFSGLNELEYLCLESNDLSDFNLNAFTPLKELCEMNLAGNTLVSKKTLQTKIRKKFTEVTGRRPAIKWTE